MILQVIQSVLVMMIFCKEWFVITKMSQDRSWLSNYITINREKNHTIREKTIQK